MAEAPKQAPKQIPGRRDGYKNTLQGRADKLVEGWNPDHIDDELEMVREFFTLCGRDQLAHRLGMSRERFEAHALEHAKLAKTISRWETKRNACFYILLPHFKTNAALLQLLNKSWLTEEERTDHPGYSTRKSPTIDELQRTIDEMTDEQLRRIARDPSN